MIKCFFIRFENPQENEPIKNIQPRIVNGNRAWPGVFPWFASLHVRYRNDPSDRTVFCGSAIINNQWVITSADCVRNARSVQINAGSVNFRQPAVTVNGDAYFEYPDYNPTNFVHNLALVRVPQRQSFVFPSNANATIAPIRLPALSQENFNFEGQEAYFQGYGYTAYGEW